MTTIFDKIIAGEIPADTVFENENVLAFRDINPQAPVHVLVIPKRKVDRFQNLAELSAEEVGSFFLGVSEAASALGLDKNGYRVVINNGDYGCQTVEYIHAHILGERQLSWPPG